MITRLFTYLRLRQAFESDHFALFSNGLMLQWWGLWLLMPWTTFRTPSYRILERISPEWGWGTVMLLSGIFVCGAIIHRNRNIIHYAYLVPMFLWSLVLISFGSVTHTSTAIPTYSMLAIWSFASYVKTVLLEGE